MRMSPMPTGPSLPKRRPWVAAVAIVVAASSVLSACGGDAKADEGHAVRELPASFLPETLLDLTVDQEDLSEGVKDQRRTYLDSLGLYSVRKDDLLQATLQVSKFTSDAKYRNATFRQAILEQIGSTVPREFRMAKQTVYLTTGKRQNVVIWFEGRYLFVLSTREEFSQARTLLRTLLDMDLSA